MLLMTLFPFDFALKNPLLVISSFRGNPIPKALMNKIDEYMPDEFFVDLLHVFKVAYHIPIYCIYLPKV